MKLFTPLLVITFLTFAVAPRAHAQEKSADSSAIKAKLKEMEDAWEKALVNKDHAAVANMVADDFAGFDTKGKHRTKSRIIDQIKNETDTLSSSVNDSMDVHVYGPNLATVSGTSTEKGRDRGRSSLFAQARELSASPRRVCPTADTANPSNERSRRGRVIKGRVAQMGFLSCRAQSRHLLLLVIVKMRDSSTSLGMTEGVNRA